jgi:hypothetical protein
LGWGRGGNSWRQGARGRRQEARGRRQEARGRRQEAGGRRQEARGKRQEAGGKKGELSCILRLAWCRTLKVPVSGTSHAAATASCRAFLPETPAGMEMEASQESFVMGTGTAAGVLPDLEWVLPRCYELRRWDAEGRPTRERLEELGLWGGSCPAYQASA